MLRRFFLFCLSSSLVLISGIYCAQAQTFTSQVIATLPSAYGPMQAMIQAADGNFYGTTSEGGSTNATDCPNGCGTIFKVTPQGVVTTLYTFTCTVVNSVTACANGYDPVGSLVQGIDGNFYGTTYDGGAYSNGTIFKITPTGAFTSLYSFCGGGGDCADGSSPASALIQGTDGNFYGTTLIDGAGDELIGGTVFKITPSGTFTTLHSFCSEGGSACNDGAYPHALLQGTDGNLYGTAANGGRSDDYNCPDGCGTIYRITPAGVLTTLYYLCQGTASCTDGDQSGAGLMQAEDGNFYGTTVYGGPNGQGEFFRITPNGGYTPLAGAYYPFAPLVLASNGNLFGVQDNGGLDQLTLAGAVSYVSITGTPDYVEDIAQDNKGNLYGNTGPAIVELIASPALPAPVQVSLSESSIALGDPVTITWQALNTFSATMQQCAAFVQNTATGAGAWSGVQPGTLSNGVFSGSATITPTVAGIYSYALTCGGVETGISTALEVGEKVQSALQLTANSPLTIGSSVATLTATVTVPQYVVPITGTVTFRYEGTAIGTLDLVNGIASLNIEAAALPVGTYPVTATYSGNAEYLGSAASANLVVQGNATETGVSFSTYFVVQGASVTIAAYVGRTSVSGTPTGTVKFSYGTTALGSATLNSSNEASITVPTSTSIPPGTYAITAQYFGDAQDAPSTGTGNLIVQAATTTTLSIAPSTISSGQSATLTATVKRNGTSGVPTGTMLFNGNVVALVNGMATFTVTDNGSLPVGTNLYTAQYLGDTNDAASDSTSKTLTVGTPGNATVMTISVAPTTASLGQLVTVGATITRVGEAGNPAGTVTFTYNSASIGSAPLVNGTATLSFSIPADTASGDYILGATYAGDAADQTCSGTTTLYVGYLFATSTALTVTPNPVAVDSALTMTAKVKEIGGGTGIPTGTVSFMVGTYVAGTATLDATGTGTVNLTDVGIPAATYPVTAAYSGDAANATSTSAAVNVVVQ